MIEIHLDGTRLEREAGTTLGQLIPDHSHGCIVAVIRPTAAEAAETRSIKFFTTAGEVVVEITEGAVSLFEEGVFDVFFTSETGAECFNLGWADRYAAAFGPCESTIKPARTAYRYHKGDVILGCGGYDPHRSYLIFAKMNHIADHGAASGGGVIGRVVTGRSVLDRWTTGDVIEKVERVVSWEDQSLSFTTTDMDLVCEDGMHIISRVEGVVEGYSPGHIETGITESVEHLLLTLQDGYFWVGRDSSTHIRDEKMAGMDVPQQLQMSRLEGTITVRSRGKSRGCVYIYTQDSPSSPVHTVVGRVMHGIELVKLARQSEAFSIRITPERLDFLGLSVSEARILADERSIALCFDNDEPARVVVGQDPPTTLELLSAGAADLATQPLASVVDIMLDDVTAPVTCRIFRDSTGLQYHRIGSMPLFFIFEDVYLFKPRLKTGTKINLENLPTDEVPANMLAMTNDSRKGAGLVGIRTVSSTEFGPTSEPFGGTNVIGRVLEPEKLKNAREGDIIYIREVMQ
jgi:putative methanogenesis marker protein 3